MLNDYILIQFITNIKKITVKQLYSGYLRENMNIPYKLSIIGKNC